MRTQPSNQQSKADKWRVIRRNQYVLDSSDHRHYFLCVINLAKNEGYVIDVFNLDMYYKRSKKEYIQHALALIILCQKLGNTIPEFKPNTPKTFGLKDIKFKYCSIPRQTDLKMCGMIALMAIY